MKFLLTVIVVAFLTLYFAAPEKLKQFNLENLPESISGFHTKVIDYFKGFLGKDDKKEDKHF